MQTLGREKQRTRKTERPASPLGSEIEPTCDVEQYPRIDAGIYEVECVQARTYWDPQFRSWKTRLSYALIGTGELVYGFFHMGTADRPHAGQRSEYFRAWVIANGSRPRKRQRLSDRVFKGKVYEVRVGDVTRRFDGRSHPDGMVYSTVKEIIKRIFP